MRLEKSVKHRLEAGVLYLVKCFKWTAFNSISDSKISTIHADLLYQENIKKLLNLIFSFY